MWNLADFGLHFLCVSSDPSLSFADPRLTPGLFSGFLRLRRPKAQGRQQVVVGGFGEPESDNDEPRVSKGRQKASGFDSTRTRRRGRIVCWLDPLSDGRVSPKKLKSKEKSSNSNHEQSLFVDIEDLFKFRYDRERSLGLW